MGGVPGVHEKGAPQRPRAARDSDRTTVPTDRRTSRQTTYSNGVVFMPSRIGVTTSTSAMQNSLCKDRKGRGREFEEDRI